MSLRPKPYPETTQAAEGLPRRRFSVAELEAMAAAGILDEDERIELIGGEVVPMSPKGSRHEWIKTLLLERWIEQKPRSLLITPETTFRLDGHNYLEPDIVVFDRKDGIVGLTPKNVLLVVEIADSTVIYDMGRKAAHYANYGVRDYWVIRAANLETRIHRDPSLSGYKYAADFSAQHRLEPAFCPELAIALSSLEAD
jgi:Uma2 family endonuclease